MKRHFGCKHDLKQPIFGPNDFTQRLGYPGQPDHAEVVKTMREITRRVRQAGRRMQLFAASGTTIMSNEVPA